MTDANTGKEIAFDNATDGSAKAEIAIRVKDLDVEYKDMERVSIKKIFSKIPQASRTFRAVKGVSFDVRRGEILGICGKNGSGKSTLLNAIAGIFSPDAGSIDLFDNTISLLSIGVGFQSKLSGKDNIYLSGLLLGYNECEIKEKYDAIVAFSELGDSIKRPVSTYSRGMYSKLAFSITSVLETDIILIDEVFSVGDARFKEKSYNRMKELIDHEYRTVLIVSHSIKALQKLCSRIMWLHNGKIKEIGEPQTVLKNYEKFMLEDD